jgi:superfamily I DNA/RNA helicase
MQSTISRFTLQFLFTEWKEVVDAWQLTTWEAYRDVPRLGRKTRISGNQRERLWSIFVVLREKLAQRRLLTWPMLFARLTGRYAQSQQRPFDFAPFDFAVVDECQDLSVSTLRFLAALGKQRADSLFFTGDLGQRIFQTPFSWETLGVSVRGRSHILTINYRTSHQIRRQADRLLPTSLADVDGNVESRRGTISVFNGPPPEVRVFDDREAETQYVGQWIAARLADGLHPQEIGVFVRTEAQLPRALAAITLAGAQPGELDERIAQEQQSIAAGIMHLAKGLEFRAVVVMACDDEVIPLQARIEEVADESDLEEVYDTERHLLYVACTRAREYLLVTGVAPASEFLDDLGR